MNFIGKNDLTLNSVFKSKYIVHVMEYGVVLMKNCTHEKFLPKKNFETTNKVFHDFVFELT